MSKLTPAPTSKKKVTRPSFLICAEGLIKEDQQKAELGEIPKRYAEHQRDIIKDYLFQQFGSFDVSEIKYGLLDEFKNDLHRRQPSSNTIKLAFSTLGKGVKSGQGKLLRRVTVTKDLIYEIPFIVYTFIRPSDLKTMQHKHFEIRSGARGDYLYMPIPEAMKHDKPITSLPRAAYYYKKLREHHRQIGYGLDEDFLFLPDVLNRDSAYDKIAYQREAALTLVKQKPEEAVTLHALRHTAIMYRLIFGGEINLLTLARNARTSIAMIERFYASRLEGGMVIDELHKKKA